MNKAIHLFMNEEKMNQNHLLIQSNLEVFFSRFDNIQISSKRSLKHKYVFLFLEIKHKF